MKKRIICFVLVIVSLLAACSCSCVRGNSKYDYDDLTEYIKLPNYKNHEYSLKEDDLKLAIGTYLMQYASEYTIKRGDRVNVDIRFFKLKAPGVSIKAEEITELFQDDIWLENVATPDSQGKYQISYQIENGIIGTKINGKAINKQYTLADDFFVEEYRGTEVFVDITVNNKQAERGDVVMASYTGYYLNDDGTIMQEEGKDKTFDTSDSSAFFIGAHLAIDDFENGLIGATIGEEKDIYATFPSDYEPVADLAGKKVLFKAKIKSFYTAPTYDDSFVQTYFVGFKTTKEFEEALKKEYTLTIVYEYISENSEIFEYPKAEYKAAEKQLIEIEGSFASNMNTTLDKYLQSTYGMTRDEYIKSNMKTEMIFYSLRNMIGASIEPTEAEMSAARDNLIADYKNQYMQNDGLTESAALATAKDMVDALGESYIYENVLYSKIDNIVPTQVKVTLVPAVYDDYVFDAQTK
ncbi:MAG: hypothetical protein E7596_07750 [Ruminococcaceae bacterium]|nr:hypothetical protein [Oscillospiraceae bacterium]